MKRTEALQPLSSEHHTSLALARQCTQTAEGVDPEAIAQLCAELVRDFPTWERHFQLEEQAIFQPAQEKGGELATICAHLEKEHNQIRALVRQMAEGDPGPLAKFGSLLHDHTRVEERLLFPLVEQHFSAEELEQVLNLSRN